MADVGSEDAAIQIMAEGSTATLVLKPGANYVPMTTNLGVVLPIPNITDEINVGLLLIAANHQAIDPSKSEWVIGTDGVVNYDFEDSNVRLFAPRNQQLSFQLVKLGPVRTPGIKTMGVQLGIFDIEWVLDYGLATARTVAKSTINMDRGSVVTLQAQGCSSREVRHMLPRVRRAEFSSVHSTLHESQFELPIYCYGEPSVQIGISPQHAYDAVAGVGLADSTGSQGVGVQLLPGLNGETAWDFKMHRKLSDLATHVGDIQGNNHRNVPFRARYYQVADEVRTGLVTVIYTVSIHYD